MISTPGTPQEKPIRTVKDKDKSYLMEIMLFKLGIYFIAIGIVKFIIYFIKKMGIKNAER